MHHLANKAKWAINSEEEKFMMTFKNQAQKVKRFFICDQGSAVGLCNVHKKYKSELYLAV